MTGRTHPGRDPDRGAPVPDPVWRQDFPLTSAGEDEVTRPQGHLPVHGEGPVQVDRHLQFADAEAAGQHLALRADPADLVVPEAKDILAGVDHRRVYSASTAGELVADWVASLDR